MEKEIKREYSITITEYSDDTSKLTTSDDSNFSTSEIIGFLELHKQLMLMDIINSKEFKINKK